MCEFTTVYTGRYTGHIQKQTEDVSIQCVTVTGDTPHLFYCAIVFVYKCTY